MNIHHIHHIHPEQPQQFLTLHLFSVPFFFIIYYYHYHLTHFLFDFHYIKKIINFNVFLTKLNKKKSKQKNNLLLKLVVLSFRFLLNYCAQSGNTSATSATNFSTFSMSFRYPCKAKEDVYDMSPLFLLSLSLSLPIHHPSIYPSFSSG